MNGHAPGLLALCVDAPMVGAILGLILQMGRVPWPRAARIVANLGIVGSFISATALSLALGTQSTTHSTVSYRIGTWLHLSGSRHLNIDWGLTADLPAAIWIAVVSGLAMINVVVNQSNHSAENRAAFSITSGIVVSATIGFVLSSSLVQMLTCWTAISLATLMLVGWTATTGNSVQGMRRAVQAGLPGDILLLWAVLLIDRVSGSDSFSEVVSPTGLVRLGAGNPAFPGLIGCLLVLSAMARCGLFPSFGWHQEAEAWDARVGTIVYGVAYVPSALWMLLKFQPLVAAEVPASLLGGLGTLGAVLGAFVACGQGARHRRLGYLLAAQTGILMAGLGSGQPSVISLCAWHQCGLSLAAWMMFAAGQSRSRFARPAVWCAALSVSGLVPFSGGWSQPALMERNVQQVPVAPSAVDIQTTAADASLPDNLPVAPEAELTVPEPRWGWIVGLWIAQGLSAFAVVKIASPGNSVDEGADDPLTNIALALGAALLFMGGPCAWWLGIVSVPVTPDSLIRCAIGQGIAIVGLFAGWWAERRSTSPTERAWGAIARLSEQRLYVDQVFQRMMDGPNWLIQQLSRQPSSGALERAWSWMFVRSAAWLGLQTESLQVGRVDFYVATLVLGTVALLLTLILAA